LERGQAPSTNPTLLDAYGAYIFMPSAFNKTSPGIFRIPSRNLDARINHANLNQLS